jgi:hypothetical protein
MSNPKSLGPKVSQRFARKSSQSKQTSAKKLMKREATKRGRRSWGNTPKKDLKNNLNIP